MFSDKISNDADGLFENKKRITLLLCAVYVTKSILMWIVTFVIKPIIQCFSIYWKKEELNKHRNNKKKKCIA